jgi:hypothetical protein
MWNVARPVLAGAEEERHDDYALRAARDATAIRCGNRRLGQFHVGWLDDFVTLPESLMKKLGDLLEHAIALVAPRAVIHDDDADLHIVAPLPT